MENIDLVLTYVNNNDKDWQHNYKKYAIVEKKKYDPNGARFRSWDNFKYVLRSIAENMQFINNLYIIVSDENQIPEYINKDSVNIIYHKDIIPEKFLPTFNSNTIEMFMYKIKDLSENFLYSNDDIFFINKLNAEDFFDDNMNPKIMCSEKLVKNNNVYIKTLKNTQKLILNEHKYSLQNDSLLIRSNHSVNPMKKSVWDYYWNRYKQQLNDSITRFRNTNNITQELSNYHFYINNKKNKEHHIGNRKTKYFNFVRNTISELETTLSSNTITAICVNDSKTIDLDVYKNRVNNLISKKFPNKCKYEQ